MTADIVKRCFLKRSQLLSSIINDSDIPQSVMFAIDAVWDCYRRGGKVFTAGNGGSAAQSQHLVAELMGRMKQNRPPISAISLTSDSSVLTCIGNDYGYERVFSRQLEAIASPNDLFIAFTTSGKSRNILEALQVCCIRGIPTMVISGAVDNNIKRLCDAIIEIPSAETPLIQEIHMMVTHMICEAVEQLISEDRKVDCIWDEIVKLGENGYQYLILDRDGVVNITKSNGYITSRDEFSFTPGFKANIAKLSSTFKRIFIATNQKGVGKGLMTMEELESIHQGMLEQVAFMGGRIDKVYTSTGIDNTDHFRKPNTGMFEQILRDYPEVELNKTLVVGDSYSDRLFADNIKAKYIHL